MGGAHSSQNRWKLGPQGAEIVTPHPAVLVGPQRKTVSVVVTDNIKGGRADGSKRPRTVDFWNSLEKTYVQQWTSIN
ncbi:jg23439 [Pararge aegeria aegeria]|uniref:Jg23439 protein n=1 Tax=Pararge aegeria aegeria TaxID=348720 RepID=A0A8S4S1C8_9NEOP|nr:jg23439 [Pararge aegeria aegeria]